MVEERRHASETHSSKLSTAFLNISMRRKRIPLSVVLASLVVILKSEWTRGFISLKSVGHVISPLSQVAPINSRGEEAGLILLAGRTTQAEECVGGCGDGNIEIDDARSQLESIFVPKEIWDGSGIILELNDRTFSRSTKRAVAREKRLVSRVGVFVFRSLFFGDVNSPYTG